MLFAHPFPQNTWETYSYYIEYFTQWQMYCWFYTFSAGIFFFNIFHSTGMCSIQNVWYLLISCLLWTAAWLFIDILVVNKRLYQLSHSFILKFVLSKYVSARYAYSSVHTMNKAKPWMGHQVATRALTKNIWYFFPTSFINALWFYTTPLYLWR